MAAVHQKLVSIEQNRLRVSNDKKSWSWRPSPLRKDITDMEMVIQKLENEKNSRVHNINGNLTSLT